MAGEPRLPDPKREIDEPSHALACDAEWIEQQALIDWLAASSHGPIEPVVERLPGVTLIAARGVDSLLANRVFVDPSAPRALASLRKLLARRGARHVLVQVPRRHAALFDESAMQHAGLVRYRRSWIKLARLSAAVAEQPEAMPIDLCGLDDADAFAQLLTRNFGAAPELAQRLASLVQRPRWYVFVARAGNQVAAAAALFVQGEIGHLGFAATAPEYRGHGLQRALIARRLRLGQALGCRLLVSETGLPIADEPNPSLHNLLTLGLRAVETRDNYVLPGTTWR